MRWILRLKECYIEVMIRSHPCDAEIAVKDRQAECRPDKSGIGEYNGRTKGFAGRIVSHQVQVMSRIPARPADIDRPVIGDQGRSRIRLLAGNRDRTLWGSRACH